MEKTFHAPNIVEVGNVMSLNEWLSETEKVLQEQGYEKSNFVIEEDLCYLKTFGNYRILLYFFDYREEFKEEEIAVKFKCELLKPYVIRFSVSSKYSDISLQKFETMAKAFFETMVKF